MVCPLSLMVCPLSLLSGKRGRRLTTLSCLANRIWSVSSSRLPSITIPAARIRASGTKYRSVTSTRTHRHRQGRSNARPSSADCSITTTSTRPRSQHLPPTSPDRQPSRSAHACRKTLNNQCFQYCRTPYPEKHARLPPLQTTNSANHSRIFGTDEFLHHTDSR